MLNWQALSESDPEIQKSRVAQYTGFIILVGVVSGLASVLQQFLFNLSGEKLTARLRQQSFATIVNQQISFFDEEKNGVGFLISRLANDASLVKGVCIYHMSTYILHIPYILHGPYVMYILHVPYVS